MILNPNEIKNKNKDIYTFNFLNWMKNIKWVIYWYYDIENLKKKNYIGDENNFKSNEKKM